MHTTDPARGKNVDSPARVARRGLCQHERRGDGRRAIGTLSDRRCNVACRDFANTDAREKSLELFVVETNCRDALRNGGDCWNGTTSANGAEHSFRGVAVVWNGKSLREHRALERDDWSATVESALDFGKNSHDGKYVIMLTTVMLSS